MANPEKGKKKESSGGSKEDIGTVLRRLSEEVVALRADVEAVRSAYNDTPRPDGTAAPFSQDGGEPTSSSNPSSASPLADDGTVARLGYAFSSIPKVALLRNLYHEGELSAAELGDRATLTTGSLYHHLRELIHAGVVAQSSRNRYALTETGRRALLAVNGVLHGGFSGGSHP